MKKTGKKLLSVTLALALTLVSLFTTGTTTNVEAIGSQTLVYWDGTKASSFDSGTGTEADPYIIATAEQLAYCAMGVGVEDSTGKFYKVADGIDAFIMQPESVIDADTLMALDSAEAVKDYLTGLTGVKNWMDAYAWKGFNGSFDGNGVTIYGLWADGISKSFQDVGLFPRYDGGYADDNYNVVANVCKNVAVKNSYFSTVRRVGVISGASYSSGYDAKIDGIINYDTIAVVNCYITANASNLNHYNEEAIIAGGGSGDVSTFNNCLVRGNYAYNTAVEKNMGIVSAVNKNGVTNSDGELVKPKMSNSIILGSDPFRKDYYSDPVFMSASVDGATVRTFFNNVITDQNAGTVTVTNPSAWSSATTTTTFTEDRIKQITATGFAFQAVATTFDWENTWFMSEDGPELRAFHGEISLTQTKTTHIWQCADCGLTSPSSEEAHTFVTNDEVTGDGSEIYYCSICDYACQHNAQSVEDRAGDCVTPSGVYSECDYCDWYIVTDAGTIPGHKFTYVEADPGNCATEGHAEYWECSVCDNKFTTDDIMAPMDTAVTDAQLNTGVGGHLKSEDANGLIVFGDENGHWYVCSVDGGRLDYSSNALADDAVVGHSVASATACGSEGHTISCPTCGYKSDGVVPHRFIYGICTVCGWECKDHDYIDLEVIQTATCTKDELTEQKCSICGHESKNVTATATGHDFVQSGSVYECSVCGALDSNAEGATVTYPLSGAYDADYVEPTTPDVSYEEIDIDVKVDVDQFTGFDTTFCVNPEGNGTAANPYIIKTANQFAAVATGNLVDADGNYIDTTGLYFKIADNIKAFDLTNTDLTVDISGEMTAAEVETALKDATVIAELNWEAVNTFKGNFDGNGACVYGLKATAGYSAIFPKIGGNITVKNFTVKNCYFIGNNVSAFFGANTNGNPGTGTINTKHYMYNCQAYGNVLVCTYSTSDAIQKCGILIGQTEYPTESNLVVTDCLVYDNIAKHETRAITYGIVGNLHRSGSLTINSSIIMGSAPHALYYGANAHLTSTYNNLYTDMMGIQWVNVDTNSAGSNITYKYSYTVNDGIPTAGFNHFDENGNNLTNNGYGYSRELSSSMVYVATADEIKAATALDGIDPEKWTFNEGGYPTPKIYKIREYSAGTNWSGEVAVQFDGGDGTVGSPFEIDTAEELALMLMRPVTGAYYKLVADIEINDTSAENWTENAREWFTSNDVPTFEASFDGNGHTVSGIYYSGSQAGEYAGLIPVVGNTAEIRNVTIADSAINANKGAAGAVAGAVADNCAKVVEFNAISVKDTVVFAGNAAMGGIVGQVGYSVVHINDCISRSCGLVNNVAGEAKVKCSVSVGVYPFANTTNIIAENVYTDTEGATLDGVTVVANADMLGEAAVESMSGLAFPTSWVTVDSDYPAPTGDAVSAEGAVGEPWTGAIATQYASGTGTEEDPYTIETAEQLAYLVYYGNPYSNSGHQYYKLTADIYLNDVNSRLWQDKVGCLEWYTQRTTRSFNNIKNITFDGDGHVVYGLYYDSTYDDSYSRVGLFPMVDANTVIKNVGISEAYLTSDLELSGESMGALVGLVNSWSISYGLDGRDAAANKLITEDPEFQAKMPTISNCFVDHTCYISAYYTGGFVGTAAGTVKLENCIFTGSLGGQSDSYYTGALVGSDYSYGSYYIDCISIPQTGNMPMSGSAHSSWRTEEQYQVSVVENVYYISSKHFVYNNATRIGSTSHFSGAGARDFMTGLDWADDDVIAANGAWRAVAGRTPILTVFEKHLTQAELLKFTYSIEDEKYSVENATEVGDNAFTGDWGLTSITIADGVTEIGDYAFEGCTSLESITIPDSVKSIGTYAFSGCTSLKSIVLPDSVKEINGSMFDSCFNLESVVIPDSVCKIYGDAFENCRSLSSVTIGVGLTDIYGDPFKYCNNLAEINVDPENRSFCSIDGVLFSKDATELWKYPAQKTDTTYTVPDTVTTICYMAFYACENLEDINIPDSVRLIDSCAFDGSGYFNNESNWQGDALYIDNHLVKVNENATGDFVVKDGTKTINSAFMNCNNITGVTIPDSVEVIGYFAFYYCTGLTSITIPESVTEIANCAFYYCQNLTSVTIGDSVESIGKQAFAQCHNLSSVTIGDSVESIGDSAFCNCYNLTSVTIPNSVTSIGDSAFCNCTDLTSVTIPDSVTEIGNQAFYGCTNLTSITIPDSVTRMGSDIVLDTAYYNDESNWQNGALYIGNHLIEVDHSYQGAFEISDGTITIAGGAFQNCKGITSVTIPNSVVSIGDQAFFDCDGLTSITVPDSVKSIGNLAFGYSDALASITIPDSVTTMGNSVIVNTAYYNDESNWQDGALYVGNHLMRFNNTLPDGYVIKDGTITIAGYASSWYVNGENVSPEITNITIPNSVKYIGEGAFYETVSLENVIYKGTEEQWSNVTIADYNVPLLIADISFGCVEHTWEDHEVITEGDCTTDRVVTQICTACGETQTVTITAIGHTAGETGYDTENHWTICGTCGDKINEATHTLTDTETDSGVESGCECGYSVFTANASDEENNVNVSTESGSFPSGTEMLFDLIDEAHEQYSKVREILSAISSIFTAYDITPSNPLNDGAEAEISFAIPEDFGNDVSIYYVNTESGTYEKLNTVVRGGRAYAKTNHFSTYALIDETQEIDETTPVFTVGADSVAVTGSTITVTVSVNNNPGIISMLLRLGYDTNVLELVSYEGTDFTSIEFGPQENNPFVINWVDPLNPNNTNNGVVATFTFNVKEGAATGNTVITIDYDAESVFNENLENVEFATQNATVEIVDYLIGDVNADGEVNVKDMAILMRYINKWEVTIDERAADVNADGLINNKDYVILTQYLNDWDVELKYS